MFSSNAIVQGPQDSIKPPIVLVHGAYNSADVWSNNLLQFFVEKGYPVYAIELKAKDSFDKFSTLWRYSFEDYLQTIEAFSEELGQAAYFIGHSMGGLLVQNFASRRPRRVLAIVLLASLPPFGLKNTLWSMLRNPLRFLMYILLTLMPAIARKSKAPKGLITKAISDDRLAAFKKSIVRESARALFACLSPKFETEEIKEKVKLVIGAEYDNLALVRDVEQTARLYDAELKIYPKMGHFLHYEPHWEAVAMKILQVLES